MKKASDLIPFARILQLRLVELFKDYGIKASQIQYTLALDASYDKEIAYTSAVLYDLRKSRAIKTWNSKTSIFFPYIPSFLYAREAPPLIKLLSKINEEYDILLVDAHGRLHPRRAGLATILGILLQKPAIGIAKSLLAGHVEAGNTISKVKIGKKVEGFMIKQDGMKYYASQGNLISLDEILNFLKLRDYSYPEELKIADKLSKSFRMKSQTAGPALSRNF